MAFFLHSPYLRNHNFMNLFSYYFILFSSCNFNYCYISFILGLTASLFVVVDIFFILLLPSLPSHVKICNKKWKSNESESEAKTLKERSSWHQDTGIFQGSSQVKYDLGIGFYTQWPGLLKDTWKAKLKY